MNHFVVSIMAVAKVHGEATILTLQISIISAVRWAVGYISHFVASKLYGWGQSQCEGNCFNCPHHNHFCSKMGFDMGATLLCHWWWRAKLPHGQLSNCDRHNSFCSLQIGHGMWTIFLLQSWQREMTWGFFVVVPVIAEGKVTEKTSVHETLFWIEREVEAVIWNCNNGLGSLSARYPSTHSDSSVDKSRC